jgi:hypothetical protein
MAKQYKIHPAIGIARLGASTEFYLGPDTPGVPADPGGSFRDSTPAKKLKTQAAAFWVFEHDSGGPAEPVLVEPGAVLGNKTVARVEWTVHLANKKAFWFQFDGLVGSKEITTPPGYGYGPTPGSWRNPTPAAPADRRTQLVIDFGPRTVPAPGGAAAFTAATAGGYPVAGPGPLQNAAGPVAIDSLGTLTGRADGGLVVAPAPGASGSIGGVGIGHYANNPGWFDNTSDGPVRAELVFTDGSRQPVDAPAWVVVAPPDFAPVVTNVVTLYDALVDLAVRRFGARPDVFSGPAPAAVDDFSSGAPPFNPGYVPSYKDDVYPVLSRPGMYGWVQKFVASRHRWDFDALSKTPFVPPAGLPHPKPAAIFNRLRRPEDWHTDDDSVMPVLFGDDNEDARLTLTPTQYHTLRQWAAGTFDRTGWVWPVPPRAPNPAPRAADLDRAALEACAGGAFYPGIELGWIVREPALFVTPFEFRFKHPPAGGDPLGLDPGAVPDALYPGDATKRMACPWQADFYECREHWWPAQRPDQVVTDAATLKRDEWARNVATLGGAPVEERRGMVVHWDQLGLVVPGTGGVPVETERTLP